MGIPIAWTQFTSTAARTIARDVSCEQCGLDYVYRMERQAKGSGSSLYFLDDHGAQDRAQASAQRALRKKLEDECDVVPCPGCGWVQGEMVRKAKRDHVRWLIRAGVFVICAAVAFGIVNWASGVGKRRDPWVSWHLFALIAAIGPGLLVLRVALCSRLDPNMEDSDALKELGKSLALPKAEYDRLKAQERERQQKETEELTRARAEKRKLEGKPSAPQRRRRRWESD